ncbi:hypothetical protein ACWEAF_05775 [Streptomyces sp. NPDC005071]
MKSQISGLCLLLSVLAAWCALAPYHVDAPEPRPQPTAVIGRTLPVAPSPQGLR